jgi:hypothetical protein
MPDQQIRPGDLKATIIFLAVSCVYLYLTLFRLPATPIFFENDHFIQMYDAVRMLDGDVMYRDFFQFTFPGTEVWYLMLFSVFGERIWLLNATILMLGLALTWTILAMSRRVITGWFVFIAPAIFLFFGFRWYAMDGGHRLFSCLFAALAILVLLKGVDLPRLAAAGALAAVSSFFTQTRGVAIVAAIGFFLVWHHYPFKNGEGKRFLVNGTALAGSFGAVLLILIGYFLATAGVPFFVRSTLLFAQNYNSDPVNNSNLYLQFWEGLFSGNVNLSSLPVDLFYYLLVPAVYIIPIAYCAVRRTDDSERWGRVILLSLAGLFLFLVTTGLSAVRLYHVAIPGLILFVFWLSRVTWRAVPAAGVAVIVAASLGLAVWGQLKAYPPPVELPTGTVVFTSDQAAEKYVWLNENTEPGDLVFESFRTVVNFPLRLKNPASVPMLRDTNYSSKAQVERVIFELGVRPPKFILWDGNWSKPAHERHDGDHLAPMYELLQARYQMRQQLTPVYGIDIEVWEQRGADGK